MTTQELKTVAVFNENNTMETSLINFAEFYANLPKGHMERWQQVVNSPNFYNLMRYVATGQTGFLQYTDKDTGEQIINDNVKASPKAKQLLLHGSVEPKAKKLKTRSKPYNGESELLTFIETGKTPDFKKAYKRANVKTKFGDWLDKLVDKKGCDLNKVTVKDVTNYIELADIPPLALTEK